MVSKNTPVDMAWAQAQPRIVQYRKRRFALRLETVYWQQLESLAERRAQRLGRIIADLAEQYQGPNLSSYIRGYCMVEAQREIARYRLNAGAFDLIALLRGCPAPALLLDHDRRILDVNNALLEWAGSEAPTLRHAKFDTLFIPRVTRPLDETYALMQQKQLQRTQIQVTFQGRAVNATLTGLPVGLYFYGLVWLHTGRIN